jgi:hypothetical protein
MGVELGLMMVGYIMGCGTEKPAREHLKRGHVFVFGRQVG